MLKLMRTIYITSGLISKANTMNPGGFRESRQCRESMHGVRGIIAGIVAQTDHNRQSGLQFEASTNKCWDGNIHSSDRAVSCLNRMRSMDPFGNCMRTLRSYVQSTNSINLCLFL